LDRERDIKNLDIPQLPLELIVIEICDMGDNVSQDNNEPPNPPLTPIKTESEPIAHTVKPASGSSGHKLGLAEIKNRWPEVLQKVQQENQSLALVLKLARPSEVRDKKLVLYCQYPIHAERLKHQTTREAIEGMLAEVLGESWSIVADIVASDEPSESEIVSPLLETFGGEVVG